MAGADTASGAPSGGTEEGPRVSRATMSRRIGSASAAKMPSSAPSRRGLAATRGSSREFSRMFPRIAPPDEQLGSTRLDDVPFQALRGLQQFGSLPLGDAERIEGGGDMGRSEERRVGKECRSRWSSYQ